MVKVQLILGTAPRAFPVVALPDLLLYARGDYASRLWISGRVESEFGLGTLDSNQLELENFPPPGLLSPRIDKMKDAVVGPDPLTDLLVDSNQLWRTIAIFVTLGSLVKLAILRERSAWGEFWLIYGLRILHIRCSRMIVAFVDQHGAIVLYPILIGRVGAH